MRPLSWARPFATFVGLLVGPWSAVAGVSKAPVVEARASQSAQNSEASVAVSVLWVEVLPGPTQLEPDEVRAALEREFGLPTLADAGRPYVGKVTIEGVPGPAVIVRYESRDGSTRLERRMTLPADPARRPLVVSWMVGNLVRNEAAEILAGLVKPSTTEVVEGGEAVEAVEGGEAVEAIARQASEPSDSRSHHATEQPRYLTESPTPAKPDRISSRTLAQTSVAPVARDLGPARFVHLALYSPALALHRDSSHHRYRLALGGVYSHIGSLEGLGLTWFVDHVDQRTEGVLITGIWSKSGGTVGALLSGLVSHSDADLEGVELAGLAAIREGCVTGAQLAGLWATAAGPRPKGRIAQLHASPSLVGLQLAGLVTHVSHGFRGVQVAGVGTVASAPYVGAQMTGGLAYARAGFQGGQVAMVGNIANGRTRGIQFSGGFNVQHGELLGAQVSGGFNGARDVRGLQFGLVNLGREVQGMQLGIVNVARENRGLSLGLFNWTRSSRFQPTYFFQTPALHNIGYKTLAGVSTSSVSFGYDSARDLARTHFAFGVRSALDRFAMGVEAGYGWVLENFSTAPRDRAHELDLVGTVTLEVVRRGLSLYGGGGVALPVAGLVPIEPHGLGLAGISIL